MILDNHLTYLQSEYQLTFEKASQDYQETTDIEDSRTKVSSLKEQIEKLGPVNLNSIEQYEQVSERHTFLATQRDDLLAAKTNCLKRWMRWMMKCGQDSKKYLKLSVKNSKLSFQICLAAVKLN